MANKHPLELFDGVTTHIRESHASVEGPPFLKTSGGTSLSTHGIPVQRLHHRTSGNAHPISGNPFSKQSVTHTGRYCYSSHFSCDSCRNPVPFQEGGAEDEQPQAHNYRASHPAILMIPYSIFHSTRTLLIRTLILLL